MSDREPFARVVEWRRGEYRVIHDQSIPLSGHQMSEIGATGLCAHINAAVERERQAAKAEALRDMGVELRDLLRTKGADDEAMNYNEAIEQAARYCERRASLAAIKSAPLATKTESGS